MIQNVNPYLNFPGNTLEAFRFYAQVFGAEIQGPVRFRDMGGEASGMPSEFLDAVAHIALPLGEDHLLMGTDVVGPWAEGFVQGTNGYIHLTLDSAEAVRRLHDALSEGGTSEMPVARTEWAEAFGSLRDRFGTGWMLSFEGAVRFGEAGME